MPSAADASASSSETIAGFNTIDEALESFQKGEFVIVLDDEDRENEGDLIVSAHAITTEQMAWFIRHTSGYICISVHPSILSALQIPMMVPNNTDKHKTAYTVTVDYKHGTTTGISAHDRALTARMLAKASKLVAPQSADSSSNTTNNSNSSSSSNGPQRRDAEHVTPQDFSRPGHMVPLRYAEGGVRVRKGHTEASVDLCRACSLPPVALLCELVDPASEQGAIAARDACLAFAREHKLKVITIEALRRWREQREGPTIPEVAAVKASEALDRQRGVRLESQEVVPPAAPAAAAVNGSAGAA